MERSKFDGKGRDGSVRAVFQKPFLAVARHGWHRRVQTCQDLEAICGVTGE